MLAQTVFASHLSSRGSAARRVGAAVACVGVLLTHAVQAQVLIVAPHPDDEALFASGIIYQAHQRGLHVTVVLATNGDCQAPTIGPVRQQETVAAMGLLGLAPADVIFLGYPDCGLNQLYYTYTTAQAQYTSLAGFSRTYASEGLGGTDYHEYIYGAAAPYNGFSMLADLTSVLRTYRPQDVYVTSAYDDHSDHAALNLFLGEALLSVIRADATFQPTLHDALVHAPCELCDPTYHWPMPTFTPTVPVPMPPALATTPLGWNDVERVPVPLPLQAATAVANLKYQAIARYATQGGAGAWLESFVKHDEIFWPWELWANRALTATATASSAIGAENRAARVNDAAVVGSPRVPVAAGGQGEWVSNGELAGAWVQLAWPTAQALTRVVLHDRPDPAQNILSGTLTFSDGSGLAVGALPTTGVGLTVTFAPKAVTWVRFTVTAAAGTATGLAELEAYGAATAKLAWHALAANTPPAIVNGPIATPASLDDLSTTALTVTGIDADGDTLTYAWRTTGGRIQGTGASVIFTPDPVTAPTAVRIDVIVADGRGGTAAGFVTVTVARASAPHTITGEATVTASSERAGQMAAKAFDGVVGGYPSDPQSEWATVGELTGAWIQLTWRTPHTIARAVLHDRVNLTDHILGAVLRFSDGSVVAVGALPNDGTGLTQDFPARTVTWVRFEVTSAVGGSTGLAEWEIFPAVGVVDPLPDIALDFGPMYGVWLRTNPAGQTPTWSQLHTQSPTHMAAADLDANGQTDLIFNFPGWGVWIWSNNTQWIQLHPLDVTNLVVGDLDGNGRADLIMAFPGYGLYAWMNNTTWVQIHTRTDAGMATANLDNDAGHRDELIVTFPGAGVWVWTNNTTWVQLHPLDATHISTGDMDGNGVADVTLDFAGYGLWTRMNNATWVQRHTVNSSGMTVGNLDGDSGGRGDLVVDFRGYGLWVLYNETTWRQLSPFDVTLMATSDLDGNGQADLIVSVPGYGLWIWMNNTTWMPLHPFTAEDVATGRIDRQ